MGLWNKKQVEYEEEEVDLKVKIKMLFIQTIITLLVGLIYAGIGLLIAYLIANRNDYKLQDAVFSTGCLIVVLGLFMMMHKSSSGDRLSSWGSRSATAANHWLLQTTLQERESNNIDRDTRKHTILAFVINGFSFLLGGVFLAAFSILFL